MLDYFRRVIEAGSVISTGPNSKHRGRGFRRAAALYFGDTLLQRINTELDWKHQLAVVPPSGGKKNAYNAQ
jgi:hypothetical protein